MKISVADWTSAFSNLPADPRMSLRAGDFADNYEAAPPFSDALDQITATYLEEYFWGLSHLDAESWLFYLPHLLRYSLENISNPASNAIDAFLFSLRPPDRDPPRFGSLDVEQAKAVAVVLDQLAFADNSAWKEQAMIALEEYWAPGATYRQRSGT